jgi:hypothetical protein
MIMANKDELARCEIFVYHSGDKKYTATNDKNKEPPKINAMGSPLLNLLLVVL